MAIQTEVGLASVFVDILEGGANSNKNSVSQQLVRWLFSGQSASLGRKVAFKERVHVIQM